MRGKLVCALGASALKIQDEERQMGDAHLSLVGAAQAAIM